MDLENLKVKDIKTISLLSRFSSLRALARHLNTEPQNLSKKIDSIETSLQTKLFERSPKGIILTSTGGALVQKCQEIILNINELEQVRHDERPYDDYLNICSRGYIINYLCPYLVRDFEASTLNLGLRFTDLSPEAIEKSARDNQLNTVFSFGEIDLGKNWVRYEVGKISHALVVKKNHPLQNTVSWEDFKKYKLVGASYIENNQLIVPNIVKFNKKAPLRGFDSENSNYTKGIVANSLQIGYLPKISVIDELRAENLKVIQLKRHKEAFKSVYLDVHIDYISNKVKNLILKSSKRAFSKYETEV